MNSWPWSGRNPQLWSESRDQAIVVALDRLARRPGRCDFGEDFRQRHEVRHRAGRFRRRSLIVLAVGQRVDAMKHADCHRLAANGTQPAIGERLFGGQPRLAFAMTVEMVLSLFGKELDRADIALPGLE